MVDTRQYALVKTHKVYNTKSRSKYKLWTSVIKKCTNIGSSTLTNVPCESRMLIIKGCAEAGEGEEGSCTLGALIETAWACVLKP